MEEKEQIRAIIEWLKNPKNKLVPELVVVFALGFLLLTLSKIISPAKPTKSISENGSTSLPKSQIIQDQSYEDNLERQLEEVFKKVKGVGEVSVMITLENETTLVPAFNTISNQKTSEEKDSEGGIRTTTETQSNQQVVVLHKGGEDEPLVVKKSTPSIKGVLIVAEGASSSRIVEEITRAAATVLDIPIYKIKVLAK